MDIKRFKTFEEVDYEALGDTKEVAAKKRKQDIMRNKAVPLNRDEKLTSEADMLAKKHKWDVDKMNAIYYNYLVEANEHDLAKDFVEFLYKNL